MGQQSILPIQAPIKGLAIAMAAAVFLLSGAATADESWLSGKDLLESCKAKGGDASAVLLLRMRCRSYIAAVDDSVNAFSIMLSDWSSPIVIPKGTSKNELASVVTAYLEKHPESLDLNAAWVVIGALLDAYAPKAEPSK